MRCPTRYSTVIIDINSHQALDVLSDRTAQAVAASLKKHPVVRVACRDRAGAYAEATRVGQRARGTSVP